MDMRRSGRSNQVLLHWACFLIFLINWALSCSPRQASAAALVQSQCRSDSGCPHGQFCRENTYECVNCTDCGKFKMTPGKRTCAKGKVDCGDCQPGFTLDDGKHCAVDLTNTSNTFRNSEPNSDSDDSLDGSSQSTGLNVGAVVWSGSALVTLLLLCYFVYGLIIFYKKKSSPVGLPPQESELRLVTPTIGSSNTNRGADETNLTDPFANLSDFQRSQFPPPYDRFESVCTSNPQKLERSVLVSAMPIDVNDLGNFPSSQIYYVQAEEDALVPDLENVVVPSAPQESSNLGDMYLPTPPLNLMEWSAQTAVRNPPDSEIMTQIQQNLTLNTVSSASTDNDTRDVTSSTAEVMEAEDDVEDVSLAIPEHEVSVDLENGSPGGRPSRPMSANDSGNASDASILDVSFSMDVRAIFRHVNGLRRHRTPDSQRHTVQLNSTAERTFLDLMQFEEEYHGCDADDDIDEPNVSREVPSDAMDLVELDSFEDCEVEVG